MAVRAGILGAAAALCGLLPACTSSRCCQAGPRLEQSAYTQPPPVSRQPEPTAPTVAAQLPEDTQAAAAPPPAPPQQENQDVVQAGSNGSADKAGATKKIPIATAEDQDVETLPPDTKKEIKPDEPLVQALRCFLDNRAAEAIPLLAKYDQANQDVFLCLLPLAARLTEVNLSQLGEQDTTLIIDQLISLMEPMRPRAALTIDKMCFCRRDAIYGFGVYEPLPEGHPFRPGEDVHVYVEMRNFSSEKQQIADSQCVYVTRLKCSAEIWGHEGRVFRRDLTFQCERPDESRTLRHDYFDHCRFYLPKIPPGNYTLRLRVTDVPTQRTVQSPPLPFRVTELTVRGP